MTLYYDRDGITIYHGDCLEVMKQFPDKSFDLCLTDPPYGVGIDKTFNDDFEQVKKLNAIQEEHLKLIIFTSPKRVADIIQGLNFVFRRMLWWYKPNDIAHSWHGFQMVSEAIMIFTKGKPCFPKQEASFHDTITLCNSKQSYHPCCKPLGVISPFIKNFSTLNNIVLDPFMGSGTTLVAAKKLGRRAVGIEISEKYCEIAVRRIEAIPPNLPFDAP